LLARHSPLLRTRRLDDAFPIEDAIALLEELATVDTRNDRRRTWYKRGAVACIVLAALFLFAGLPLVAPVPSLGFVALVVLGIRLSKIDIPNEARELVLSWLRILAADLEPGQSVSLKLDFNPATAKTYRVSDQRVNQVRCLEYLHPWYSGETVLADGARLGWDATTRVRERVTSKRSRSGKIKHKSKRKYWTKLEVSLALPADHFTISQNASAGPGKVRTKAGEKRNVVRVSRVLCSLSPAPPPIDELIATVALAYRQVAPMAPVEQTA
jgi:hypothetical protein